MFYIQIQNQNVHRDLITAHKFNVAVGVTSLQSYLVFRLFQYKPLLAMCL